MIQMTIKSRRKYERPIIFLTAIMLCLYIFVINGDIAVTFLFLRSKFGWTLEKYTLFSSVSNLIWIACTMLGVYLLQHLLKVIDSVLVLMGFLSMLNGTLLQAVAKNDWPLYMCKHF